MTSDRFRFQAECANESVKDGIVLNVGANTDPAGLGSHPNVLNCDIFDHNPLGPEVYPVDHIFDCTEDVWPFDDNSVELVILGDIVEHMYPAEFIQCMKECRRVSQKVCITLPLDTRITDDPDYAKKIEGTPKGHVHVHVYEEPEMRDILRRTGWKVVIFQDVDYGFVSHGFYILAVRDAL